MALRNVQSVLHIGPGKTGSTAIQQFCDCNRAALAGAGICYPESDIDAGTHHGLLGSYLSRDPLGYPTNKSLGDTDLPSIRYRDLRYFRRLEKSLRRGNHKTAILSYEGFYRLALPEIRRLQEFMASVSDRQKVVFYCRDPMSYACSALSQAARLGRMTSLNDPLLFHHAHAVVIPRFVEIFGRENVIARRFDWAAFEGGNVVSDFFQAIGHPIEGWEGDLAVPPRLENVSLSMEALMIAVKIAKHYEDAGMTVLPAEFRQRYGRILSNIRGEPVRLTASQCAAVAEASRCNCAYLEREFGITFAEAEIVDGRDPGLDPGLVSAGSVESIAWWVREFVEELDAVYRELDAVYRSKSWRVTAPLRFAKGLVQVLRRAGM